MQIYYFRKEKVLAKSTILDKLAKHICGLIMTLGYNNDQSRVVVQVSREDRSVSEVVCASQMVA